eukprot:jgi/Tetstr1/438939/TSEL_002956.t1
MTKSSLAKPCGRAKASTKGKKPKLCADNKPSQAGVTKRIPKQEEGNKKKKFQWNSKEKEFLERIIWSDYPKIMEGPARRPANNAKAARSVLAQVDKSIWANLTSKMDCECPRNDGKKWKTQQLREKFRNELFKYVNPHHTWSVETFDKFASLLTALGLTQKNRIQLVMDEWYFQDVVDARNDNARVPAPQTMKNKIETACKYVPSPPSI